MCLLSLVLCFSEDCGWWLFVTSVNSVVYYRLMLYVIDFVMMFVAVVLGWLVLCI